MSNVVMQIKTIQTDSTKALDKQVNEFLKGIPFSLVKDIKFTSNYDVETTIEDFNVLISYAWIPSN
ncbi:hypothetical protein [Secundilactobacillus odoratitofui]|uniref:hypothetical protein n=1 Tax=Secundilactobacillus odoratitofui TaxID=480930 RepID=UPI0006D12BE5|nr:hypothetical protein [Secundilactobacillus odoratitofui]